MSRTMTQEEAKLNYGDIYFKNDILTVTFKQQEAYINGDLLYGPYDYYEVIFLDGKLSKYCNYNKESIDELIFKRLETYNLIPKGCKIIPKDLVGMYRGMFIGGILEDSIQIVYGISEPTIRGFSCSVFFIPSDEVLATLTDYDSVSGALKIKGDNYDIKRCDVCCDVLDGIYDGVVYDCSKEVHDKLGIEHICEDCLASSDDLVLTNTAPYVYVVEIKGDNYE